MRTEKIIDENLICFDGWVITMGLFFFIVLTLLFGNKIFLGIGSIIFLFLLSGFFIVLPNEAIYGVFFGNYKGSQKNHGFYWINPLVKKQKISIKIQNLSTNKIKVNDKNGTPIDMSSIIIWKINDVAKSIYSVENNVDYLNINVSSILNEIICNYSYNDKNEDINLQKNIEEINKNFKEILTKSLYVIGIEVLDVKINQLSFPPEIEQLILRQQQIEMSLSMKKFMVDGTIGIVQEVLSEIEDLNLAKFSNADKINLINNLMTAIVSNVENK